MRERLKGKVSETVIQNLFKPSIDQELESIFPYMMKVNKAHVIMLEKQKIISTETAKQLLQATEDMEKEGAGSLNIDYSLEDLHYNIEQNMIEKIGIGTAGFLHTARSRNDLAATTSKMDMRKKMTDFLEDLIALRKNLLFFAEKNTETLMPAYTHFQAAQPITLAHYLSSAINAFERDFQRALNAFNNLNKCPLGACAVAGTGFPIDREFTASLLGFNGVVANTIDSVATKDYVLEILSTLNMFMTTLNRISQDFYTWSSETYQFFEVGDDVAATSSIMPQKKNPITFEHIKGKSSHVIGALVSSLSCLKNTTLSHTRDVARESLHYLNDAFYQTKIATALLIVTFNGLKVNRDRMQQKIHDNFCTVTELADYLVVKENLSFRQAHQIVSSLVSDLVEKKQGPDMITPELVRQKSRDVISREIEIKKETLEKILDPFEIVSRRTHIGGPAPSEVSRMLDISRKAIEVDSETLRSILEKINKSDQYLQSRVAEYLNN